jgi:hypothetical protein
MMHRKTETIQHSLTRLVAVGIQQEVYTRQNLLATSEWAHAHWAHGRIDASPKS